MTSRIEWTDRSDWNPIRGCTRISEGCRNCYAEAIAARFSGPGQPFHGFAERTASGPRWTGKVELIESRVCLPTRWRKPSMIFVNSAFDLFHEAVPDEWIDRVFAVMALAPQHTFQVLTKRSARMREYMNKACGRIADTIIAFRRDRGDKDMWRVPLPFGVIGKTWWPLQNVWIGVSAEDQERADERIPDLLATPAAVRWVSAEPLLGPVDFTSLNAPEKAFPGHDLERKFGRPIGCLRQADALRGVIGWAGGVSAVEAPDEETPRLDWIVVGGESQAGARPMHPDWARSIRDQCAAASVPFFMKQMGGPRTKMPPIPADLFIREMPNAR